MKRMSMALVGLAVAAGTTLAVPAVSGTASAATNPCPQSTKTYNAHAHYLTVLNARVATDKKTLAKAAKARHRAEKTLGAEKKHHQKKKAKKQAKVVAADEKKATRAKAKMLHDEHVRAGEKNTVARSKKALQECQAAARSGGSTGKPGAGNPGSSTTPDPTTALNQLLTTLIRSGIDPSALTDALNSVASEIGASSTPGAAQLAAALDEVSTALANGAASVDPTQLQEILSQLPAGFDPSQFATALTQAATEIQQTLATPPTTGKGLVDAIVTPLEDGLTTAGAPTTLTGVLDGVQSTLDGLLGDIGLGGLPSLPGSGGLSIPGIPTLPLLPILSL